MKESKRGLAVPQRMLRTDVGLNSIAASMLAGLSISTIMFLLRLVIHPILGERNPFALGIVGVLLSAYFYRFWAGIVATISTMAVGEIFFAPDNRLTAPSIESALSLGLTFAICFSITLACERLRVTLDYVTDRERRAADSALETARAYNLLNSVLDNTPTLIAYFDEYRRLVRANSGSKLPLHEWIGRSVTDIFSCGVDRLDSAMAAILNGAAVSEQIEFCFRFDSGDEVWLAASLVGIQDDSATSRGVFMMAIDLTDRKALELQREGALETERLAREEAELASRMKDEFVATLSHELRTPLTSILGWTELMRIRSGDPDIVPNGVAAIEKSGRAQLQMVEDLLDLNRINSGKLTLEKVWFEVAEILDAAVDSVRVLGSAKGISIQVEAEPRLQLLADPIRFQQIVVNLLSNAIKFSPVETTIRVECRQVDGCVQLEVEDQGEGIEPAFLPNVFDRFRQGDSSVSRKHGGLGLGLAIVRQLVELHGGDVQATSPGVGKGSVFRIRIPSASDADFPAPVLRPSMMRETAGGLSQLQGIRVLLVDDDAMTREIIGQLLTSHGASVVSAASTSDGMEILSTELPDIVLTDIGMPGEDGYQFLSRIRNLPDDCGGRVPAVALTAFARSEDRRAALLAGFQGYISKPVDIFELISNVRNLSSSKAR